MFSICLKLGIKRCFTNAFFNRLFYHQHIVVSSLHIVGDMYTPSSFSVVPILLSVFKCSHLFILCATERLLPFVFAVLA